MVEDVECITVVTDLLKKKQKKKQDCHERAM